MAASQLPVQFPLTFTMVNGGPSAYNDVYGITWDNGVHGWVYGQNFILVRAPPAHARLRVLRLTCSRARAQVTHNGGATWTSETPNDLLTASGAAGVVKSFSNVPTTH